MEIKRCLLIVLVIMLGILPACSGGKPEPQPTTAIPPTPIPPTKAPPTAAIVISSPTDTPLPEPTVEVNTFLPSFTYQITKDNILSLKQFGELPGTAGSHVAISPDNHWLATAYPLPQGRIIIWDLFSGQIEKELNGAWTTPIQLDSLFFLPDGVLVSHSIPIGGDGWRTQSRAQYWDVSTGTILKELDCYYITYSPDGSLYAYMPEFDEDSMFVYVVDAATDRIRQTFAPGCRIHSLVFSGDNSTLVGSTGDAWQSQYTFWNLENGTVESTLYDANCLAFSDRAVFAIVLGYDSSTEIGELAKIYQENLKKETIDYQIKIDSCPLVYTRSVDMLVANVENYVRFYNALDLKMVGEIHVFSPAKIYFSPDRTILAIAEFENDVRLFAVWE